MSSLENLRRQAKALKKAVADGDTTALARVMAVLPDVAKPKHADALHVIASENGFTSWPKLKFAREALAMDRDAKAERLKMALYFGQHWVVDALLSETPDLGRDNFGLACALYDIEHVRAMLEKDKADAKATVGVRNPMAHLAFSQHFNGKGSKSDMLAVAEALVDAGAQVNDFYNYNNDPEMPLSCLYGALGHAQNMDLGRWLLEHGADPNDGESLYHACELGHCDGLRLLLQHGAKLEGTNALAHSLDFNNLEMTELLLKAGADPKESISQHSSGEPPFVIAALHQAVRRMCDPEIVSVLIQARADPSAMIDGVTPFAMAKVFGHKTAAKLIEEAGGNTELSQNEHLLASAVDGPVPAGRYLDVNSLPDEFRDVLRNILNMPGKMGHMKRLVAIGAEWDRPDSMGVPPVQVAGWEGLPDVMGYFLSLKPDLSHQNSYGGTLLGTIIHGSENCGKRAERDHIECARLALHEGVALPETAIKFAGDPDMAAFLAEWAEAHPGQVVKDPAK